MSNQEKDWGKVDAVIESMGPKAMAKLRREARMADIKRENTDALMQIFAPLVLLGVGALIVTYGGVHTPILSVIGIGFTIAVLLGIGSRH